MESLCKKPFRFEVKSESAIPGFVWGREGVGFGASPLQFVGFRVQGLGCFGFGVQGLGVWGCRIGFWRTV